MLHCLKRRLTQIYTRSFVCLLGFISQGLNHHWSSPLLMLMYDPTSWLGLGPLTLYQTSSLQLFCSLPGSGTWLGQIHHMAIMPRWHAGFLSPSLRGGGYSWNVDKAVQYRQMHPIKVRNSYYCKEYLFICVNSETQITYLVSVFIVSSWTEVSTH